MSNTEIIFTQFPKTLNEYTLEYEIAKGTFGSVYSAVNQYTEEKVAIKIYSKKSLQLSISELSLINNEITTLKLLNHKNIVKLYEIIESQTHIFLVMELCPERDLFSYIYEKKHLSESEALCIFRKVIDAMIYIHKMHICHRDIKPENILLDSLKGNLKLIDFEYSCYYFSSNSHLLEDVGTPSYACCEMHIGIPYQPEQADVWSCGVLLYTMVCGFLPFSEEDEQKNSDCIAKGEFILPDTLSEDLKDLIKHMLCIDVSQRFYFNDVIKHKWFNKDKAESELIGGVDVFEMKIPIDERVLNICEAYEFDKDIIREDLKLNKLNKNTAIYHMIDKKVINEGMSTISDLKSEKFKEYKAEKGNWLLEIEKKKIKDDFENNEKQRRNLLSEQHVMFNSKVEKALKQIDEINIEYNKLQEEKDAEGNTQNEEEKDKVVVISPEKETTLPQNKNPSTFPSSTSPIEKKDENESISLEKYRETISNWEQPRESSCTVFISSPREISLDEILFNEEIFRKRGKTTHESIKKLKRFRSSIISDSDWEKLLYLKKANPKRRNATINKEDVVKVNRILAEKKEIILSEDESDDESEDDKDDDDSFDSFSVPVEDEDDLDEEQKANREIENERMMEIFELEKKERMRIEEEKRQRIIQEEYRKYQEEMKVKMEEEEKQKKKEEQEKKERLIKRLLREKEALLRKQKESIRIEDELKKQKLEEEKEKERIRLEAEAKEKEKLRIEEEAKEKERLRLEEEKRKEEERLRIEEENSKKEKLLKETEQKHINTEETNKLKIEVEKQLNPHNQIKLQKEPLILNNSKKTNQKTQIQKENQKKQFLLQEIKKKEQIFDNLNKSNINFTQYTSIYQTHKKSLFLLRKRNTLNSKELKSLDISNIKDKRHSTIEYPNEAKISINSYKTKDKNYLTYSTHESQKNNCINKKEEISANLNEKELSNSSIAQKVKSVKNLIKYINLHSGNETYSLNKNKGIYCICKTERNKNNNIIKDGKMTIQNVNEDKNLKHTELKVITMNQFPQVKSVRDIISKIESRIQNPKPQNEHKQKEKKTKVQRTINKPKENKMNSQTEIIINKKEDNAKLSNLIKPSKYTGIVDVACISVNSLSEIIRNLEIKLNKNNVFFIHTTPYIFRCIKLQMGFDIKICEIANNVYYYLLKIYSTGINIQNDCISQFFD